MNVMNEAVRCILCAPLSQEVRLSIELQEAEAHREVANKNGTLMHVRMSTGNMKALQGAFEAHFTVEKLDQRWIDEAVTRVRSAVVVRMLWGCDSAQISKNILTKEIFNESRTYPAAITLDARAADIGRFQFNTNAFQPDAVYTAPPSTIEDDNGHDAAHPSLDCPGAARSVHVDSRRNSNDSSYHRVYVSLFSATCAHSAPVLSIIVHHLSLERIPKCSVFDSSFVAKTVQTTYIPYEEVVHGLFAPLGVQLVPINIGVSFVVTIYAASGRVRNRADQSRQELLRVIRDGRVMDHLLAFTDPQIICQREAAHVFKAAAAIRSAAMSIAERSPNSGFQSHCRAILAAPSMSTLMMTRTLESAMRRPRKRSLKQKSGG